MSVSHKARVFKLETKLLQSLCKNIGTPRSLTVALLAQAGEWKQLLDLKCDPLHYDDPGRFADDYLVTTIMQKNPRLPTDIDRRAVAIGKFRASEDQCREANLRLSRYQEFGEVPEPDIHRAVHHAREIIRGILGPTLTRRDLGFAESKMRFGPGATTSLSGVVTQGKKYSRHEIDATPRVASFRAFGFPSLWKEAVTDIRLTQCSKLTTVPKSAKTDRVICIEPDLNIFVQLGFGALLREKLRVAGLDLNTQETNQTLAQHAHEFDLCTLDLSSASDTIGREVVWLLLPFDWANALHFSRVDKTSIDGEVITLEKWSSMGNGYTFELETLLFWGVVRGCLRSLGLSEDLAVAYGDDLIFPDAARELTIRTLEFLGFSVNRDKTFGKGVFHESCGTDWFKGVNVRPVFLRTELHDFQSICYLYANNFRRWARRRSGGESCDSRLLPVWLICFRAVDPNDQLHVPEGVGDVGFVVDFDFAKPTLSRRFRDRGWCGFTYRYRSVKAERRRISEWGCYLASLNGISSEFSLGIESLRGRYRPATLEEGHVLAWPNLGPWR